MTTTAVGTLSRYLPILLTLAACAGSGDDGSSPTQTPTTLVTATAILTPSAVATATHSPTRAPTPSATTTVAQPSATPTTAVTSTATQTPTTTGDQSQIDLLPPTVSAAVDSLIQNSMATNFIPGLGLAVAQNGQTVLAKGYGYAQCATLACTGGTPVYADTPFELGSVTKAFTAIGLLRILDNPALNTSNLGPLALDAPISQYLATNPDFTLPAQWDNITPQQLLSMSSGVEDFGSNRLTWPEILDQVGMEPLLYPPGSGYCYSNPGFMLVGAIIQQLTETAYDQFMQQQVFTPAAMDDTLIHTPDNTPSNLAIGYAYDGSTQMWTVPMPRPPLSSFSAGAIISTAVDLGKFIGVLQNRALLNAATYELMWTDVMLSDPPRPGAWGFGWEVTTVGAYQIFRKDGGLPGITSQMSLYDDGSSQIGVAIASNEDQVAGYAMLAVHIMDAILGTPVPNPGGAGNGCTPTPCFNCPTPTPTPTNS